MASFYFSTAAQFLSESFDTLLARLSTAYAHEGFTAQFVDQTLTWERDLRSLRQTLGECMQQSATATGWGVVLEFDVPRKARRIDVVVLVRDTIVIVEAKTSEAGAGAKQQAETYALLLHYFHKASDKRKIVPVLVLAGASAPDYLALNQQEFYPQTSSYWIAPVTSCSWEHLPALLLNIERHATGQIAVSEWESSPYFPVPSIIDAALALRNGLSIGAIAKSEASEHEIEAVRETIQDYMNIAREQQRHGICFLTGVPGSGKTLVGLGLAHASENKENPIHFMSGNGPLVKVLQHLFAQESQRQGTRAHEAKEHARTLIENVHVFAKNYTDRDQGAPSNHAIVFDEAQRAWNRAQNMKKFQRDYSEPEMLLRIMERHEDWSFVVALVGGGQEINDGEAGLEEWGRALRSSRKKWTIYASPEVLQGGPSTAGHKLFEDAASDCTVITNPHLHLRTSNRSLRAEKLASWVNCVLDGDADGAAAIGVTQRFPIFLTRSLDTLRRKLHAQRRGDNRYCLVGSSGAARLRAEGLEPSSSFHAEYAWEHWYLAGPNDVRSSYCCEVFATEFEIQGLELDWIGLCWGGDMVWIAKQWQLRALRHGAPSKWNIMKNEEKRSYRKNAYRVLLTRARQGMVIFVPRGSTDDPTNAPEEFDATARFLLRSGVLPLDADMGTKSDDQQIETGLFA
ncbi:MAG: DUF2075 domain-containing protein [Edaphobacter sp.]|uniref:DUF2075 domain-containing protein n=1 Tax=Edaphobacter sp. TaxID=1934404 RepID=UPI00238D578C|nr:DUF2075 domain-containing protein [Edaphobacter sp.]MDE1178827.1 DUF2075 domain-containing protein [Edaphobacter sp.]